MHIHYLLHFDTQMLFCNEKPFNYIFQKQHKESVLCTYTLLSAISKFEMEKN